MTGELCEVGEPNNDAPQATALSGSLEASFCPAGDVDFYVFEAEAGQTVQLRAEGTSGTPGAISLTLFNAAGDVITQRFAPEVALEYTPMVSGSFVVRLVTTSTEERFDYVIALER